MLFGSGTRFFGQSRYRIRSRSQRDHPTTLRALVRPSARTSQPCSDFSNPNKVRPLSGGNKSCALNSLDMALSLDDQVHVPAPKLRKNLNKEKRHRSTASTSPKYDESRPRTIWSRLCPITRFCPKTPFLAQKLVRQTYLDWLLEP
jgi:hypothetical protein